MSLRKLARSLALTALLPLALATCGGASFDDPSVIKGLRVIAVQKSAPYPKPGEQVNIKLLFWDAKSTEEEPRNLFVAISPVPCENPKGDLYYNCLAQFGGSPDGGSDQPDAGDIPDGGEVPDAAGLGAMSGPGTATSLRPPRAIANATTGTPGVAGFLPATRQTLSRFRNVSASSFVRATRSEEISALQDINHTREVTVRISSDIIDKHAVTPGVVPYGLAYVLFIACAGTPRPVSNPGPNELPFGCFDANDRKLGSDDFVIGYTSMYVYNERVNANPVIDDLLFDNASLANSTMDESAVRHVPSCKDSDRSKCPKYAFQLAVNRSQTVEIDDDPNAKTPDGQPLQEQAWVSYYLTAGELKSSVRLVNDATRGWNDQNGTEFTAPAEPGPVRFFGVVHDNRGGVAWAEGKIIVD
jgi:hypothetical protein